MNQCCQASGSADRESYMQSGGQKVVLCEAEGEREVPA